MFKKLFAALALLVGMAQGQVAHIGTGGGDGGPTLPATCTVGQTYFQTATAIGFNLCLTPNTWSSVNVGGGGSMTWPAAAGIPNYSGSSSWSTSYSASNPIPFNFLNITGANIVSLWASGACTGLLKSDLTCTTAGTGNIIGSGTTVVNSVPVWNNVGATAQIDPGALQLPSAFAWQGTLLASGSTDLVVTSNAALVATVDGTVGGMWLQGTPFSASSSGVSTGANPFLIGQAPNPTPITSGKTENGQSVILAGGAVSGSIISNGNVVPGDVQFMVSGRKTSGTVPAAFQPGCWSTGTDNVGGTGHNTLAQCGSTTAAAYQAGVTLASTGSYLQLSGQTQYVDMLGKFTVNSSSSQNWTAGDNLCTDPNNALDFIDGGTSPCLCPSTRMGTITTTSTGTVHIVQYVPSAACTDQVPIYYTQFAPVHVSLASTNLVATPVNGASYIVTIEASATDGGTGCTSTGTVGYTLTYQEYNYGSSAAVIPSLAVQGMASNTVISSTLALPTTVGGPTASNIWKSFPIPITASSATAISLVGTYTAGGACTTGENYSATVRVVQVH